MNKFKKITLLLLVLVIPLFFAGRSGVFAQTPAEQLKAEIAKYEAEVSRLQGQANTLKNQIAQFDAQIYLTLLKIEETQSRINLLGGRIDQLEGSLSALDEAFSSRVRETYKMQRMDGAFTFFITAQDFNQAATRMEYLKKAQESDRQLLTRLQKAQDVYTTEKSDQEDLAAELDGQKKVLGAQKTAKAQLLTTTQNDEKRYQQLLNQARAQLASLSRYAESVGVSLIPHQDISDGWGKYFNQRDEVWGNQLVNGDTTDCRGGSCTIARIGCLVTSYAMVVSHYGGSLQPSDVASNPSNFYSTTADFNYPGPSANGHSATAVSNPTTQRLVDELNSGKTIIAGLSMNGGPYPQHYSDHWVVLRSVDGDSFRINDPVYAGAMNVSLKDHYSGWTIIQARIYN